MDVGNPNNFKRIKYIYSQGNKLEDKETLDLIKHDIKSYYIDETETLETIKMVKNSCNYIIDPHTAVAFASYLQYDSIEEYKLNENHYIIVSTAHPSKFDNILNDINIKVDIHKNLLEIKDKFQEKMIIRNEYDIFKKILFKSNYRHIVLIGMPGSGKSTISKYLFDQHQKRNLEFKNNLEYLELDKMIEKEYGDGTLKLPQIIEEIGEKEFKVLEEVVLVESIDRDSKDANKMRIISPEVVLYIMMKV